MKDVHKYVSYAGIWIAVYATITGIRSQWLRFGSGPQYLWVGVVIGFPGVFAIMEVHH